MRKTDYQVQLFNKDMKIKRNKNGSLKVNGLGWNTTSSEHGKSKGITECPCCGHDQEFYIWSLHGSGKKCDSCNVVLGFSGASIEPEKISKEHKAIIESMIVDS